MVELAFGSDEVPVRARSIVEFDRGWFNAVYRVRLRSGRDVVLKIAPDPGIEVLTYEQHLMRNELAAMNIIAASGGVAVPEVLHADLSGKLIRADWYFMSLIVGDNLGRLLELNLLSPGTVESLMSQLGDANRRLNDIDGPAFGTVVAPTALNWRTTFTRWVEDVLSDARRVGLDIVALNDRAISALETHGAALDDVRSPRLVAWDLWPGNAIVRGDRLIGIVDHERAMWGDPVMEAGFMTREIPIYPEPAAFARGYDRAPLGESETVRRRLYSLHLLLVMFVEPAFRGPQDPRQAEWSRERLIHVLESLEC